MSDYSELQAMENKQGVGHEEPRAEIERAPTAEEDVSFFHDFIAGGVAGSLSIVVGHPFDTLKVSEKMKKFGLLSFVEF
jgi:hypothetical protein